MGGTANKIRVNSQNSSLIYEKLVNEMERDPDQVDLKLSKRLEKEKD